MLIKTAYQVHDDQIIGGPGWLDTDRFDVAARGTGDPSTSVFRDQARLMLRAALSDRFALVFRREQREIPIYALVLTRTDGQTGPQLSRTDLSTCDGPPQSVPVVEGAVEAAVPSPCDSAFARAGHIGGRRRDIATLVTSVSGFADHLVIDGTGLTGKFDWDLQWMPERLDATPVATPAAAPSLVTALREQLGLRLESRRAPFEVLVIELAERPRSD